MTHAHQKELKNTSSRLGGRWLQTKLKHKPALLDASPCQNSADPLPASDEKIVYISSNISSEHETLSGRVFSYKLRYIVGFWLVEIAISTNQKPTIYRNLYENTGPGQDL